MSAPLLLNPRAVNTREAVEKLFAGAGLVAQPAQEMITTHALVALFALGFGVSVLSKMALAGLHMPVCRCVRLREGDRREIGVMMSSKRALSPAMRAFKAFLERTGGRYSE